MTDHHPNGSDDLDRRIAAAKAKQEHGVTNAEGRAESRGWSIAIEFVGMILVSAFIGYLFDRWVGTTPWAMIVMLMLGFAGAIYRAQKTSTQFDADLSNDNKD